MKCFMALVLIILSAGRLIAQDFSEKPKVAVLNFEGRGIEESEVYPISDRFRGELVNTNQFIVLERERMEVILKEIALEQTLDLANCITTECAIKIGELLRVQKVITGSIGRVGKTYTIDLSYIDIKSAQIERSYNRDYRGEVDGILTVLKEIAQEIAFTRIPPPAVISKTPLYVSGLSTIVFLGIGTYSFFQAENSYDKYLEAKSGELVNQYRDDTEKFDTITIISGISAGVSAVFYYFYLQKYNNSKKPKRLHTLLYTPDSHTVGLTFVASF